MTKSLVIDRTEAGRARQPWRDTLLTHVEAARPDLAFYSGLVGIAGAVVAADSWTVWQLLGAWAAPMAGWFAAMYGGDYFDRDLDKLTKSQRPVPSGRMSARTALAGMVVWALLGAAIAVALTPVNLVMVVLAWAFGLAYSKYLKARGVWGNLSRGAITMCAFGVDVFAVTDSPPWALLLIAMVFWLHDAASNVVGAVCDAEGDRRGGCGTFPVRHGETASFWLMGLLHLAWFALACLVPAALGFDAGAYVPLLAVAALMTLFSVALLLRVPRPVPREVALRSHEVLVVERLVLAAAMIAATAGLGLGAGLLVPFVVATIAASLLMRGSYEPSRRWRSMRAARRDTVAPEKGA